MEESEKLEIAKWILERNLAWITASEVKVGVVVAINTAMLGALGAAFSALPPASRTAWACLFTVTALISSGIAILCAAKAILPKVTGPKHSVIFFGRISSLSQSEYLDQLSSLSSNEFLTDCAAQIHRNAEIACDKYKAVASSIAWSFFAIIPWLLAVSLLMREWK